MHIKNNDVKTIETYDISWLTALEYININSNSIIMQIAPNAFEYNSNLSQIQIDIDLDDTNLDHIPVADTN